MACFHLSCQLQKLKEIRIFYGGSNVNEELSQFLGALVSRESILAAAVDST